MDHGRIASMNHKAKNADSTSSSSSWMVSHRISSNGGHHNCNYNYDYNYSYSLMSSWPPRSYSCSFCKREFRSAQALGGHMNVHRRDKARLRSLHHHLNNPNPNASGSTDDTHHDHHIPNLNMPPPPPPSSPLPPTVVSTLVPCSMMSSSDHQVSFSAAFPLHDLNDKILNSPIPPKKHLGSCSAAFPEIFVADDDDEVVQLMDMKKNASVGASFHNYCKEQSIDLELRLGSV